MEHKDLDKLFRDSFDDAEEQPRDRVWHNIEAALEQQQAQKAVPLARKKRAFHWLHYAAAASVLVALGIVFWTVQTAEERAGIEQKVAMQQTSDEPQHQAAEVSVTIPLKTKQKNINAPNEPLAQTVTVSTKQPVERHKSPSLAEAKVKLPSLNLEGIESTAPTRLTSLTTAEDKSAPPTYRVTEIGDIKPLIEPYQDMESMYASATPETTDKATIVTTLLNSVSENIELSPTKDIRFRSDEEGSLRIDILNSLVKNRNKKRR